MEIKLQPFITPNFVLEDKMAIGKRQDGFHPDLVPKWSLSEVDPETLSNLCDDFRKEIFRKSGKKDPKQL
jgi:hypothetical protein